MRKIPTTSRLFFSLCLLLDLGKWHQQSGQLVHVEAAHSRVNYVVRREKEPEFDQSTATFSAEGHLLQLDYGMKASQRGSPAAVIHCDGDDGDGDNSILVLVKSPGKVFLVDAHVIMVASGLQGDARWLAGAIRQYCQHFRASYGEDPTLDDIAQYTADIYHTLTTQVGYRPFGCTVILAGDNMEQPVQIGQGGTIERGKFLTTGKGHDQLLKALSDHQNKWRGKRKEGIKNEYANSILKTAMQSMELKDNDSIVVWSIKPQPNRNGKMLATCFLNVDKENLI